MSFSLDESIRRVRSANQRALGTPKNIQPVDLSASAAPRPAAPVSPAPSMPLRCKVPVSLEEQYRSMDKPCNSEYSDIAE
jgi:hypothetical protein